MGSGGASYTDCYNPLKPKTSLFSLSSVVLGTWMRSFIARALSITHQTTVNTQPPARLSPNSSVFCLQSVQASGTITRTEC